MLKTIVLNGQILTGVGSDEIRQDIDAGTVKRAQLLYHTAPSKSVSIEIQETNGSKLAPATPYTDWLGQSGGDYVTSKKPMNFQGGKTVVVNVIGTEVQTSDFDFDILLLVEVEK